MTKEALKKEAEEKANKVIIGSGMDRASVIHLKHLLTTFYIQGYHTGAEPREKQIETDAEQIRALQKQNGELTDKVKELEHQLTHRNCVDCSNHSSKLKMRTLELEAQIEKMKKYIKACWIEENLNDYSSYITNSSDEFRDLVKELNDEVRNGR